MNERVPLAALEPLIREQLQNGGSATFNSNGVSMLPLIRDGAQVRIIPAVFPLKKYAVLLYKRADGQFVLHRMIGRKNGAYICRGDHQIQKERGITDGMVIGVLDGYTENGKWVSVHTVYYRLRSRWLAHTAALRAYARICFSGFKRRGNC